MENSAKAQIIPPGLPESPHPCAGPKSVLPANGEPVLKGKQLSAEKKKSPFREVFCFP